MNAVTDRWTGGEVNGFSVNSLMTLIYAVLAV